MASLTENIWTCLKNAFLSVGTATANAFVLCDASEAKVTGLALLASKGTIQTLEGTITQTSGDGTYTLTFALPAGATINDIIVQAISLWDASVSASLEVGDVTDPDGFYTAVDLKATDLLADETISFAKDGGVNGAYITATHVLSRYSASARTITATVTQVGTGSAGVTRIVLSYSVNLASAVTAATKA